MHDGLYTSMQAGMDPGLGQDFEGDMNLEFSPEELQKQREKNRNAQKRFRQRQYAPPPMLATCSNSCSACYADLDSTLHTQCLTGSFMGIDASVDLSHRKEKMRDSQKQLEQLTQQMSRLMQEKAELETRNRILEQVVKLNVDHVEQLQTNKVPAQAVFAVLLYLHVSTLGLYETAEAELGVFLVASNICGPSLRMHSCIDWAQSTADPDEVRPNNNATFSNSGHTVFVCFGRR